MISFDSQKSVANLYCCKILFLEKPLSIKPLHELAVFGIQIALHLNKEEIPSHI